MIISTTAYQDGFGTDLFKRVRGLTDSEKDAVLHGMIVVFKSRPTYLKKGIKCEWRIAKHFPHYSDPFVPRCPTVEQLTQIQKEVLQ